MLNTHMYYRMVSLLILFALFGGLSACQTQTVTPEPDDTNLSADAGKKILWVDSYHQGYEWSDGIEAGIRNVLDDTGVELKIVRLDTKRETDEAFRIAAAEKALAEIEAFEPDILIASDDNAQQYLIVPYFKDTEMPVIFCGLNWDASLYGYPTRNVTGMVEVELVAQMFGHLKTYAKGQRVGYLTVDSDTERKVAGTYNDRFFDGGLDSRFVKTYEEFEDQFLDLQEQVDIVFIGSNAGIDRWDAAEAEAFFLENTKVPTGTSYDWLASVTLLTLAKVSQEQGEWAAEAVLQVLAGTPISDISVVENEKGGLILNLNIAEKLGIVFAPSMLRNAEVYGAE